MSEVPLHSQVIKQFLADELLNKKALSKGRIDDLFLYCGTISRWKNFKGASKVKGLQKHLYSVAKSQLCLTQIDLCLSTPHKCAAVPRRARIYGS